MNPSIETIAKHEFYVNFDRVCFSDDGIFMPKSVLYHKVNPLESQYKLEEDQRLIEERLEQNSKKILAERFSKSTRVREIKESIEEKRIYINELECLKYDYDGQDLTEAIAYERNYLEYYEKLLNDNITKRKCYRPPYRFYQYCPAFLRIIYTMIYLKRHLEIPVALYEARKKQGNDDALSFNKIFSILEDLLPAYRYAALCLIDNIDFSIIEKLCIELEVRDEERFCAILNTNADKCNLSKLNTICHYYDAFSTSLLSTSIKYVKECSRGAKRILDDFIKTYPICNPLQEALMRLEVVRCFLREKENVSEEEAKSVKQHFHDIYDFLFKEFDSWNHLDDRIREQVDDLFHVEPLSEFAMEVGDMIGIENSPFINCPNKVYAKIVSLLHEKRNEKDNKIRITEVARILVAVERLGYLPKNSLDYNKTDQDFRSKIDLWLNRIYNKRFEYPNFWSQTLQIALGVYSKRKPKNNASQVEDYRKMIEKVKNAVERREQDVESTAEE